jgi:CRP/FNR family cyclic AMP-dependent transcriptional regulator
MVSIDHLERLTFCKGMAKEDLRRLVAVGEVKSYPAGTYLFREGLHSDHVYLLGEGRAALEMSLPEVGVVRMQTVGPGELLGWSPLLGLDYMTASAVTLEPCRVLALDAKRILALVDENPRFGVDLMQCLARTVVRRLRAAARSAPLRGTGRFLSAVQRPSSWHSDPRAARRARRAGARPRSSPAGPWLPLRVASGRPSPPRGAGGSRR